MLPCLYKKKVYVAAKPSDMNHFLIMVSCSSLWWHYQAQNNIMMNQWFVPTIPKNILGTLKFESGNHFEIFRMVMQIGVYPEYF